MKCVFLDRDGTLIDDVGYLSRTDRIRVKEGVFEGVKQLIDHDFVPVVLTNQSGVARGLIEQATLRDIHQLLHRRFLEREAPVFGWYVCPHLPPDQLRPDEEEGADERLLVECDCRKPENGLWKQALNDLPENVDLSSSWSVGDRLRDVEPGCGLGTEGVLFSGSSNRADQAGEIHSVDSFQKVVDVILGRGTR